MDFLLYLAIIPARASHMQWIAWRTNLPGILLLLLFGVVLGQFVKPDSLIAELTGGDESGRPTTSFSARLAFRRRDHVRGRLVAEIG